MANKKDVTLDPTKDITLGGLPPKSNETPATSHQPEGEMTCYGLFRVRNSATAGGLWVIRKIVTDNTKVLSYEDSEPDVLDIQMGKIDRFLDASAERA